MEIRKNKITIKGKNTDSLVGGFLRGWKNFFKKENKYLIIWYIYLLIMCSCWFFLPWGYRFSFIAELMASCMIPFPYVALGSYEIWEEFRSRSRRKGLPISSTRSLSLHLILWIVMLTIFSFVFGKAIINGIKDCFGGTVTREISVTAFTTRNGSTASRGRHADYYMKGFLDDGTPINIGVSFCFGGWLAVPGRSAKTKFIETMPHGYSDTIKGKITYYPHSLKFIKFEKL